MNLPTNENTIQKNERICPFEPTSPMFELSKTGNPILPVATVIGFTFSSCHIHQDLPMSLCPSESHRYANSFSQLLNHIYIFLISPVFIYFYKFSVSNRSISLLLFHILSSVGIGMGYVLDRWDSVLGGRKIFHISTLTGE
jgi:hypothetical protein